MKEMDRQRDTVRQMLEGGGRVLGVRGGGPALEEGKLSCAETHLSLPAVKTHWATFIF